MEYGPAWCGTPSCQTLHDSMICPGPITRPLNDCQPSAWTPDQVLGYPPPVDDPFVHTQHHGPTRTGGLPSPASSGFVPSPPSWQQHDFASTHGFCAPISPTSPSGGADAGGSFISQFDVSPITPDGTTVSSMGVGMHDLTQLPFDLIHTYSSLPTAHSALQKLGHPEHFSSGWASHVPLTDLQDEPFMLADLVDNLAASITKAVHRASVPHTVNSPDKRPPDRHQPPPTVQFYERHYERAPPIPSPFAPIPHQAKSKPAAPSPPSRKNHPFPSPASSSPSTIMATTTPTMTSTAAAAATTTTTTSSGLNLSLGLRTAARRVKRPAPPPKPGESPEHQRARANHNRVEQQYRHRLHARFAALLEVLPPDECDENNGGEEGSREDGEEGQEDGEELDESQGCERESIQSSVFAVDGVAERGGSSATSGRRKEGKRGSGSGSGGNGAGGHGAGSNIKQKRMSKVDVLGKAARVIRFLEGDVERVRREVQGLKREKEVAMRETAHGRRRHGPLGGIMGAD